MANGLFLSTLVCPPADGAARPSVLVVDQRADHRRFLRSSLRRRCRVVTAASCEEGAVHLRHGPPRGLVLGRLPEGEGREAFRAALRRTGAPATLKLWATRPPSDAIDVALRHPFTRADLIRAVDRLLRADAAKSDDGRGEAGKGVAARFRP